MPDWVWQPIVVNIVWALLVAGVGAAFAYARHKNVNWAPVLIYGFAGAAFMSMLVYSFIGRGILSSRQPETTPSNIEANVKAWSDKYRVGQQIRDDPAFDFLVETHLNNGSVIYIGREKKPGVDQYLEVYAEVGFSQDLKDAVAKLTPDELLRVKRQLIVQLANADLSFTLLDSPTFHGVQLKKFVPIGPSLDEQKFLDSVSEVDKGVMRTTNSIPLLVEAANPLPTGGRHASPGSG